MDRIKGLAENQEFRITTQREFMLRDLHGQHDKAQEKQWVTENATLFAVWFKRENERLTQEMAAASDKVEMQKLFDTWLAQMKAFSNSDEYQKISREEKEAA